MNPDPKEVPVEVDPPADLFGKVVALAIAIMAVALAVAGLGGNNASEEALHANVEASNLWAFFQAKTIRQTSYKLAKDLLVLQRSPDATQIEALALDYQKKIDEYESEPETGEGRRELLVRAREHEAIRDRALRQDERFDMAETLLQVAIVIASVSILSRVRWIFWFSSAVASAGAAITASAFFLP